MATQIQSIKFTSRIVEATARFEILYGDKVIGGGVVDVLTGDLIQHGLESKQLTNGCTAEVLPGAEASYGGGPISERVGQRVTVVQARPDADGDVRTNVGSALPQYLRVVE